MAVVMQSLLLNTFVAAGLAALLFLVQRIGPLKRRPQLCHALWLLLLVKLVIPPLMVTSLPWPRLNEPLSAVAEFDRRMPAAFSQVAATADAAESMEPSLRINALQMFAVASLLGSAGLLIAGFVQHRRLSGLLRMASAGSEWLQDAAQKAACELTLRQVPRVRVVDATVVPFLWTGAGGPLIVLPRQMLCGFTPEQVGLVIQHELAHYARKDHWSGGAVSLFCVLMWWNPLVWWVRRETRILQETCCDQLVLLTNGDARHCYAEALMATIDLVAGPTAPRFRPATAFGDGQTLKRRMEMIVCNSSRPLAPCVLRAVVLIVGAIVLPFGVAVAQDYDALGKRLREAVAAGELSADQAATMMKTLKGQRNEKNEVGVYTRFEAWATEFGERIKAAAARKDLSESEAWQRWFYFKEREFGPKLREAVAAGDLSEKAADRLLEGIKRAETSARIRLAVAKGEMTEEEGKAKWAEMMEKKQSPLADVKEFDWKAAKERFESAVERGEITREEADAKYLAIRKRLAGEEKGDRGDSNRFDWEGVKKRIDAAVERGDLSKEEAELRLRDMRRRMSE